MSHASVSGGVGQLARLGERHVFHRHAETVGDRARHVGRDTVRIAGRVRPVTSRKLPMLIAARRTPCGASSATTDWDMGAASGRDVRAVYLDGQAAGKVAGKSGSHV